MPLEIVFWAVLGFFIVATLYSTVGHAGASGYLAIMAILSFSSAEIKPTSLVLNILVASIASYRFLRVGYFDRRIFWLFASFSIPMAFLGGYLQLNDAIFKWIAGIFLLISAALILLRVFKRHTSYMEVIPVEPWKAGALGGVIGYVSGAIGIGGGIFLSPVLLLFHWAKPKHVSGISALFILVNSVLGLLGHLSSLNKIPSNALFYALAVISGGLLGSYLGTKKLNTKGIYLFLTLVLTSAGIKMLFF